MTVSSSTSAARRGFFLLFAAYVLLLCPPLLADTLYNFNDFASFAAKWLQTGCSSANNWCGGFDYDISGTVDAKDFFLFSENWLTSKEPVLSDDIAELIIHLDPAKSWRYDNAFMVRSLYEKWQRCHNPVYLKWVKDWLDPLIASDGNISGYKQSDYNLDMIQPGNLCLIMYRHFGTAKYKLAANRLLVQLTSQPTTTDGGFWHKNIYKYQMWLDGVFMAEPFATQYASMFNDPNWFDEAAFQITLIATHTQDTLLYPTDPNRKGLCYHGWADLYGMAHANPVVPAPVWADPNTGHSPEFWGRAIGWYAMAIVDCLDYLPADHNDRPEMIAILNDLAEGLAYYQDPNTGPDSNNGMWWQVVNKGYPRATYPTNYTESSCTAMFSYALGKAVEKGYITSDPNYYLNVSRTGYEGLVAYKVSYDVSGWLRLKDTVSVGSLSGAGDYNYYVTVDHSGLNDFKGVGALMRAALQYEKMSPYPRTYLYCADKKEKTGICDILPTVCRWEDMVQIGAGSNLYFQLSTLDSLISLPCEVSLCCFMERLKTTSSGSPSAPAISSGFDVLRLSAKFPFPFPPFPATISPFP